MEISTKFNMGDMVCHKEHKEWRGRVTAIHFNNDGSIHYNYRPMVCSKEEDLELAPLTKDEAFDAAIACMRQYKDKKFQSICIYDLPLDKVYQVVVSSAIGDVIPFKYNFKYE